MVMKEGDRDRKQNDGGKKNKKNKREDKNIELESFCLCL